MSEPNEMTPEQAVEILNRVKHRDRGDWRLRDNGQIHSVDYQQASIIYEASDALIIAQWYTRPTGVLALLNPATRDDAPAPLASEQLCERLNTHDGGKGWKGVTEWEFDVLVTGRMDLDTARALVRGWDAMEELAALKAEHKEDQPEEYGTDQFGIPGYRPVTREMKRVIVGCRHRRERMIEWIDEGACPICLTATAGMANEKLAALTTREAPPGSWPWALEQMKAGKRVQFPRWGKVSICMIDFSELVGNELPNTRAIIAQIEQGPDSPGKVFAFGNKAGWYPATVYTDWFTRTDWQLAPDKETE